MSTANGPAPGLSRRQFASLTTASAALGLTATYVGARPAAAASHTFTIGSHNVEYGGPWEAFNPIAHIIGFQEVTDTANSTILRGLERNGADYRLVRTDGPAQQVPIAFNTAKFSFVSDHYVRTHDGKPNISPHRYLHWLVLTHRASGRKLAFINTHFVSGAWNGKSDAEDPWRKRMWNTHLGKLCDVYQNLKPKMPVLLVGDMNRIGSLTTHDDSINRPTALSGLCGIKIADHTKKIDHLYATCGMDTHVGAQLSSYGSDHPAIRATVTLRT